MPTFARTVAAFILSVGSMAGLAESAVAAEPTTVTCRTESECLDLEIRNDTAARRDEYTRIVNNQEQAHAAAIQALHDAGARRAGDKEARYQAILQRRRDAYARAHN